MKLPAAVTTPTTRAGLLVVAVACLLYVGLFLQTPRDWWFEDDPPLFAAALHVANPTTFFTDRHLHASLTGQNEMAPELLASFWIDGVLAPRSAAAAYVHSGLSLLATALLLFGVLGRYFRDNGRALVVTLLWLLLPSTVVVHEFLSTRHYMEGLTFALAAIYLAQGLVARSDRREPWGTVGAIALAAFAALVSKEFYPTAFLAGLFLYVARWRRLRSAGALLAVGVTYAVYRLWMTAGGLNYGMTFMNLHESAVLLVRLVYVFAGNYGGYALVALALALGVTARRTLWQRREILALLAVVLVLSLATIYPVGRPLLREWPDHGTWYRTPFVVNTVALVAFATVIFACRRRAVVVGALVATTLTLGWGAIQTRDVWDALKQQQEAEGRFYLDNPDKLLYSQTRAAWYLAGLHLLYADQTTSPTISLYRTSNAELGALTPFRPLWRYEAGQMRIDAPLQVALMAQRARVR